MGGSGPETKSKDQASNEPRERRVNPHIRIYISISILTSGAHVGIVALLDGSVRYLDSNFGPRYNGGASRLYPVRNDLFCT